MQSNNGAQARQTTSRPKRPLDKALSPEAWQLVTQASGPRAALEALMANELHGDALILLAGSLPMSFLLGWLRHCIRYEASEGMSFSDEEQQANALVDRWFAEPDDTKRRAAQALAEELDYSSPSAWLAAAVGWSGGSIAPPDQPEVQPAPHLAGTAVVAGLALLAGRQPEEFLARQKLYAERAIAMLSEAKPTHRTQG